MSGSTANEPRREPWTGKWPGEADRERLGYFVGGDPQFPNLNRLSRDCVWNRERPRGEERLTRSAPSAPRAQRIYHVKQIWLISPVIHRVRGYPNDGLSGWRRYSRVVLGASNRVVFLLPAALMALVVASVLIVRADLDVAFTALTASVFSGGYLLGVVKANTRPGLLRFPVLHR